MRLKFDAASNRIHGFIFYIYLNIIFCISMNFVSKIENVDFRHKVCILIVNTLTIFIVFRIYLSPYQE